MIIFLYLLAGIVLWFAIGSYFLGKANAIEATQTDYSNTFNNGMEWAGIIAWPILACNVFAWEVKNDSRQAIARELARQQEMLAESQRIKARREAMEAAEAKALSEIEGVWEHKETTTTVSADAESVKASVNKEGEVQINAA